MGIAYHALPAYSGSAARRAGPIPCMSASGSWPEASFCATRASPWDCIPSAGILSLLSGAMELAAGLLFARFISRAVAPGAIGQVRSQGPSPPLRACRDDLLSGRHGDRRRPGHLWLGGHVDTVLPAALNDSFYFAVLYGFLLAWIYGFGHRIVSLFLGVGAPARGTTVATLIAQMLGVAVALHPGCRRFPMRSR